MVGLAAAFKRVHIETGALKRYSWVHRKTGETCWSCGAETELVYPEVNRTTFRCDPCEVTWSSTKVLK